MIHRYDVTDVAFDIQAELTGYRREQFAALIEYVSDLEHVLDISDGWQTLRQVRKEVTS